MCVYACPDGSDLLCDVGPLCKAGASAVTLSLGDGVMLIILWGFLPDRQRKLLGPREGSESSSTSQKGRKRGDVVIPFLRHLGNTWAWVEGIVCPGDKGQGVWTVFVCLGSLVSTYVLVPVSGLCVSACILYVRVSGWACGSYYECRSV